MIRTCALSTAFSFSSALALLDTVSSLTFLWSRDFFAARLFLFRRSKYLMSLAESGIAFFSLRERRGLAVLARACTRRESKEKMHVVEVEFNFFSSYCQRVD